MYCVESADPRVAGEYWGDIDNHLQDDVPRCINIKGEGVKGGPFDSSKLEQCSDHKEPTDSPIESRTNAPTAIPVVSTATEETTGSIEENQDESDDTIVVPPNYCPEGIKLLKQTDVTNFPQTVDASQSVAVKIISQDVSTVTVDSIYYSFRENKYDEKCYEETSVYGSDLYDTITIECNIMSPVGYLDICIADDL